MKLNIPNDDGVGLLLENINSTKNRMELQLKAKRNGKNLQYWFPFKCLSLYGEVNKNYKVITKFHV